MVIRNAKDKGKVIDFKFDPRMLTTDANDAIRGDIKRAAIELELICNAFPKQSID